MKSKFMHKILHWLIALTAGLLRAFDNYNFEASMVFKDYGNAFKELGK